MAKYQVTFSCGHTATVQLLGKEADRQKKIAWYEENGLCPKCEKKRIMAEAKEMGFPELTGSEKQVAWAGAIRKNLESFYRWLAGLKFEDGKILHHEISREVLTGAVTEYDRTMDIATAQQNIERAMSVYMRADQGFGQAFRDAAASAGITESSDKTEIMKLIVSVMMDRISATLESETSAKAYIDNYRGIDVKSMGLY